MLPIPLTDKTRSMAKPADWDESKGECLTLDIHDAVDEQGSPFMLSAWTLQPGELEKLAAGAPLWLRIYGTGHPVVSLFVGDPTMKAT